MSSSRSFLGGLSLSSEVEGSRTLKGLTLGSSFFLNGNGTLDMVGFGGSVVGKWRGCDCEDVPPPSSTSPSSGVIAVRLEDLLHAGDRDAWRFLLGVIGGGRGGREIRLDIPALMKFGLGNAAFPEGCSHDRTPRVMRRSRSIFRQDHQLVHTPSSKQLQLSNMSF